MKRLSIILTVLLGLLLAACSTTAAEDNAILQDPWGTIRIRPEDAIQIALVAPTSSDLLSVEARDIQRGGELALQRRGFIRGYALESVSFDSGCDPTVATETADAIVADEQIVGAVGFACSEACQAASAVLADANYTMVSPSCSAGLLTDEITHNQSFLRTMYDDSREGITAAQFAFNELGARRAYIIRDESLTSQDLSDSFETAFNDLGGVIVNVAVVDSAQLTFEAELSEIQSLRPDVIYGPLLTQTSAEFARLLNDSGLNRIPYLGSRYTWNDWFMFMADASQATNLFSVGPLFQEEEYQSLVETYEEQYSSSPVSVTYSFAYDAMTLFLYALEEASTINQQDLVIGRKALRDALYETAGYPGITGSITCTEWGDCSGSSPAVGQIMNDHWQVVYIP